MRNKLLFFAAIAVGLCFSSCKVDEATPAAVVQINCYTCTSGSMVVEDVCEDDFIDNQYYQNSGYTCVKTN